MPPMEAPLNTANQHAANADDHIAQGLLIPAAEEHRKAAEAYAVAVERCSDENTKRTLRMLHNDHLKAGKELYRKIEKLREENKDPSLPQKPSPSLPVSNANPASYSPQPIPSPPPSGRRMTDSQNTGEESFLVLGQRSDPGDAFNQFWKILEGMLDNLSQPVAFATAPLAADDIQPAPLSALQRNGSLSSDTDIEEPIVRRITRRMGIGRDPGKPKASLSGPSTSKTTAFDLHDEEFDEDIFDVGDELSESFCLIPAGPEASMSALKKENVSLKAEVDAMQKRLAAADRVLQLRKDQDQQLRDSIFMVRREAQRAMGASGLLQPRPGQGAIDFSALNINVSPPVPPPVAGRDREAQLLRRVRELEEETRLLRAENEKQKAMIAKFRERWDKLKESAKRKKDAKAANLSSGMREPISEEPEAEREQDEVAS